MSPYSVAYPTAYSLLLPVASTRRPCLFEIAMSSIPRQRDWMFSSVTSSGSPANNSASVSLIASTMPEMGSTSYCAPSPLA